MSIKNTLKFAAMSQEEKQFFKVLKYRVQNYLKNTEHSHKINFKALFKALFFFSGYIASWYLLVFVLESPIFALILCVVFGTFGTGLALNVGHEASHKTFAPKIPLIDDILYWFSMNMVGTYAYLWKIGHLETHHRYVNVPGYEVGIEANGSLRMASHTPYKKIYQWQHIYAPFLYCLYTFTWVLFRDFRVLANGEQSGAAFKNNLLRWVELIAIKIFYFFAMIYLPLKYSSFSTSEVFIGFAFIHIIFSIYLATMLFTSHINDIATFYEPNHQGQLPQSYLYIHLDSTVDINPESKIASFLLGGFNTHTIHHIFPHVNAIYYGELTKILKLTCREFNMPYKSMGMWEALKSHYRYLKQMGKPIQHHKNKSVMKNEEILWQS
jgi:linoleoyl-CoA desaturase